MNDIESKQSLGITGDHIYNITEITTIIKSTIDQNFRNICVEGEVSNFSASSKGHLYFTLKDDNAVLSAVVFSRLASQLTFKLQNGQKVRVKGSISVYPPRGGYQIICEAVIAAGRGDLLMMLEQRQMRLNAEGLFDAARKKSLPQFCRRIAVVTSPTGAAIQDILRVVQQTGAGISVVILPTLVQGDMAAENIAAQIRRADQYRLGDVIIVARGGGSLEDLLPFSEEIVVRAIADCTTPVVSAVGHEVNVPLSDLAADYRAPTPSIGAQCVTVDRNKLRADVLGIGHSLIQNFDACYTRCVWQMNQLGPAQLTASLQTTIHQKTQQCDEEKERLTQRMSHLIEILAQTIGAKRQELRSLSPNAVLRRGYAIISQHGAPIDTADAASEDAPIDIRFSTSEIKAKIIDKNINISEIGE